MLVNANSFFHITLNRKNYNITLSLHNKTSLVKDLFINSDHIKLARF